MEIPLSTGLCGAAKDIKAISGKCCTKGFFGENNGVVAVMGRHLELNCWPKDQQIHCPFDCFALSANERGLWFRVSTLQSRIPRRHFNLSA